ncbi:MAG: YHS domain-containing (seleno)protein [Pseudomonadales bacterium]
MLSSHWTRLPTAVVLLCAAALASAGDRPIFTHKDLAIRGYDPVAYFSLVDGAKAVAGSPEITAQYMGSTWQFASEKNRAAFQANPTRYAPQYGGYCAFAVSHGFTKPVDPDAWHIKNDKLYLNLSKRVKRKWLKDRDAAIVRADGHWPTVLTACEAKNNCYD